MPATATSRLEGITTSVAVKPPCDAVTSANITLSGLQTIGGVVLAEGDRVLVRAQTSSVDNGIYVASTSDWTRAKDFDGARDARQGTLVLVRTASVDGAIYEVTTANPIVIGTSAITFELRDDPAITYSQTQAEIDALVTPVNTAYRPGSFLRYGMDPTGVTACDTAFANACKANTVVFDDYPEGGLYTFATGVTPTRYPLKIQGAALSYGSSTGTRFNLQAAAGTGAATIHFTAAAYGIRISHISFTHADGTLAQSGIKADNELRAGSITECYFSTTDQTANNDTLGIWMAGAGTFTGSYAIRDCNFANLKYPIFLGGSVTTLRIVNNEILGSTLALASIGITIGDNCSGIVIAGNGIEGFTEAGSRGIYSAGTRIMQAHNRFEVCENAYEWIRGSTGTIKSRSYGNTFVTCGAPIYPRNSTDLCMVSDEAVSTVDDAVLSSLTGFHERGRASNVGEYITPAFSAGNFTANGSMTWTVISGNVAVYKGSVVGKTMTMEWAIAGSTAGGIANSALRILIPGSYTAKGTRRAPCVVQDNNVWSSVGMAFVQDGVAYVEIYIDATAGNNWTLSANTGTHGVIQFEVN